jgi:hypothetical protein
MFKATGFHPCWRPGWFSPFRVKKTRQRTRHDRMFVRAPPSGRACAIIADLVYLAMAAFVAWGRFGQGSFTRLTRQGVVVFPRLALGC